MTVRLRSNVIERQEKGIGPVRRVAA